MSKDSSAKYYQKRKKATEKTREKYQNLSKEEKGKKWQCECKRYINLPKGETQRLVEYRKIKIIKSIKSLILKILVRAHTKMIYTKS